MITELWESNWYDLFGYTYPNQWGKHCNPLQYSCLENPMYREASRAKVHRVTKSWTQLEWFGMHTHIPIIIMLKVKVKSLGHVRLFATLWTVAYQASPSMGFSFSRGSSDSGTEPRSPSLQADALPSEPPGKPLLCLKLVLLF